MGVAAGMGSPVQSGDAKTCSSRTSQGSSSLYRFAGRMRHAVGGSLQALNTNTTAPTTAPSMRGDERCRRDDGGRLQGKKDTFLQREYRANAVAWKFHPRKTGLLL